MKTLIFIVCCLAFAGYSQEYDPEEMEEIVEFCDIEPQFPGGDVALHKYITEHLIFPEEVQDLDFDGRIFVGFVINTDGSISDIEILRGMDPQLDRMVKNLIRGMPKWIPGEVDGKAVRARMRLPIRIHLM